MRSNAQRSQLIVASDLTGFDFAAVSWALEENKARGSIYHVPEDFCFLWLIAGPVEHVAPAGTAKVGGFIKCQI